MAAQSGEPQTERLRAIAAARYVGLAPATLAKMRCLGGGPTFIKIGRAVVYDRADLDGWVQSHGKQTNTVDKE